MFYQDIDGTIRERYYGPKREYEPSTWHPTAFEESDVLLGTSLAAVRLAPNDLLMVFFQDREGTIRFRSVRRALLFSERAADVAAHLKDFRASRSTLQTQVR